MQIAILAREAEHRAKNVLATVQATVQLSHSETPEGLKRRIAGRIQALANVHRLFVEIAVGGSRDFTVWSRRSFRLTPKIGRKPYRLRGRSFCWSRARRRLLRSSCTS